MKYDWIEIGKVGFIGLLLGLGLGLIFDQILIGVAAGVILGGGIGFALSRRKLDTN